MMPDPLDEVIAAFQRLRPLMPKIARAGEELKSVLARGGKILATGNGGSASCANHLVEELVGRFDRDRPSLAAVSLCADGSVLTCIANDYGFEHIFARQVEGLGRKGDALIVFSTSGNSKNVVAALRTARARNVRTVALLGRDGGLSQGLADHEIIVPDESTARIQEVHTFILHCWLVQLESDISRAS